jgi:hypothetical protein
MKKITQLSLLLSVSVLCLPLFSLAQGGDVEGGGGGTAPGQTLSVEFKNPFGSIDSIPDFLATIVDLLINLGGVIVVFFIVFAGFKFVIAQGNPSKIEEAKRILMYTLIGAVILLGSKVISEIIRNTLLEFTS